MPSLALDTHCLPEQGRARPVRPGWTLGLLCPTPHAAQPRNPAPPLPQGAQCPPGRGKNSGQRWESSQHPGSTAFWPRVLGPVLPCSKPGFLISKVRQRELISGPGRGQGRERKVVVLRSCSKGRGQGRGLATPLLGRNVVRIFYRLLRQAQITFSPNTPPNLQHTSKHHLEHPCTPELSPLCEHTDLCTPLDTHTHTHP